MTPASYIVIGRYSHEQSTHEISRHRSPAAAWRAARKAHFALGGCNGGNMLAKVLRGMTADELRRYQQAVFVGDYYRRVADGCYADVREIDGRHYLPDDVWTAHRVTWTGSGFALVVI